MKIYARALDELGNRIFSQTTFWSVYRLDATYSYNYQSMEVVMDKAEYTVGETAQLLINSRYENVAFLLTVEGKELYEYDIKKLEGNSLLVEIPILKVYEPNVTVKVACQRDRTLLSRSVSLRVPKTDGKLSIEVKQDKEKYRPRDTGIFEITVTDQTGNGVEAELSLAVVDESIFAIRADTTPDMFNFFYSSQPNWVSTNYSYPMYYRGGASKADMGEDVRENLKDTALWLANVVTDAQGKARVEVEFPDNLTTWRTTIRSHTMDTHVGETRERTLVTKELVARLELPRFLTEGDRFKIIGIANNLTESIMDAVRMEVTAQKGIQVEEPPKQVRVRPGEMGKEQWQVTVASDESEAEVTLRASSQGYQDAIRLTKPIQRFGVPDYAVVSGKLTEQRVQETFPMPEGTFKADTLSLNVSPSPAIAALASIEYLYSYYNGSVEQTLNSFFPNVLLATAFKEAGYENASLTDRLNVRVRLGIRRISQLQNSDGGWGWWGHDETNYYLTAYAVHALHLTKQAGYEINEDDLKQGIHALEEAVHRSYGDNVIAYCLYVLALVDHEEEELAAELYEKRHGMNVFQLTHVAMVYQMYGDRAKARELLQLLEQKAITRNNQFYYEAERRWYWGWIGRSVETTARALMAFLLVDPSFGGIEKMVDYVCQAKRSRAWLNTKETGLAVMAISMYLKTNPHLLNPDYTVQLYYNDSLVATHQINRSNVFDIDAFETTIAHPQLNASGNTLRVEKSGTGTVYYSAILSGAVVSEPIRARNNTQDELTITRTYYKATRVTDSRGRRFLLKDPLPNVIETGTEVVVELTIEAKDDFPFMVVEDYLPCGFEVTSNSTDLNSTRWWDYYSHQAKYDNRMVFYFTNLQDGTKTISYLMQPELEGEFHTIPAIIRGEYNRLQYAYSDSQLFHVGN